MSANILFIKTDLIKSRTGISNAIDDKQIKPIIKVAQDMFIQPSLGSGLYHRLQDGIDASDLTIDETDLLDNYITDSLIWYTVSLMPSLTSYQFFSKGMLQKSDDGSLNPSRADIELIEQKYKSMAEFYNTRLVRYLQTNYRLFSLYLNPGNGCDTIFPVKKVYTCPIYLGPHTDENCNGMGNNGTTRNPIYVDYTAAEGLSSFTVSALTGRTTVACSRSGLTKLITDSPTTNSYYIQINGTQVTLPTGDTVAPGGEPFTFLIQ